VIWAGYCRVSRVAGREHLISPELQQKRIRSFAEFRGWTVEMFPPELDVSGGRSTRPVLEDVIRRIERGELAGVIVSQMDRLSRMEMTTALTVIERIEAAGGQVVAVAENVDPTTPEGRMARNMFLSLAAMERERHASHLADAKERAVRLGIWPTPKVPYGYAKGDDRKLIPGPDADRLRKAFRARAAGASWREVGAVLDVGPSSARRIILNRVYLGEITVGEWHNPTAHPPLIDRALWESAQIQHPARAPFADSGVLLKGVVRCAGCSRTMSFSEGSYRCLGRAPCELRARIPVDVIDPIAERLILSVAGDVEKEARAVDAEPLADLERAEAELRAFQRATNAAGDEELFVDGLRQRVEAVRDARNRVSSTRADLPLVVVGEEWPNLTVEEKRHLLGGLFGVVWIWSRDRFRFVEAGFEPDGLSHPGRRGPDPVFVDDRRLPGEIRVPPSKDVT
jgi:DNA invertase Pin-like site-specific DNA recombinase